MKCAAPIADLNTQQFQSKQITKQLKFNCNYVKSSSKSLR